MLDIKINNESILLSGQERISFTDKNNLFDTEVIQMTYSLPFTIPVNDHNMRLFGFIGDPNSLADFSKEFKIEISISNLPYAIGSLFVSSVNERGISCSIIIGDVPVTKKLSEMMLSDIDMGQSILPKVQTHWVHFRVFENIGNDLEIDIFRLVSGTPTTIFYQALWQGNVIDTMNELKRLINSGLGTGGDDGKNRCEWFDIGVANKYSFLVWVEPYNVNDDFTGIIVDTAGGAWWTVDQRDSGTGTLTADDDEAALYYLTLHTLQSVLTKTPSEITHVFAPIRNDLFDSYDPAFLKVVNRWDFQGSPSFFLPYPDYFSYNIGFTLGNIAHLSPIFYVYHTLKKALEKLGWNLDGDFFNDAELRELVIYTNKILDHRIWNTSVAPPTEFDRHVRQVINWGTLLPDISVAQLLAGLKVFGVDIDFDSVSNTLYINKCDSIIDDDEVIEWTHKATQTTPVISQNGVSGFTLRYKFDSNDQLLSEYFQDVKGKTLIAPVWLKSSLPTSGVEDNNLCLVESENKFYVWSRDDVGVYSWFFWGDNYVDYIIGDGSKVLEFSMSPLLSYNGDDLPINTRDWLLPVIGVVGKTEQLKWGRRNPSTELHLSFYRGFQLASDGSSYPLVMSHNINFNHSLTGNYSLQFDGLSGLVEKFTGRLYNLLINNKTVKYRVKLTGAELAMLNKNKKRKIARQMYYIKSYTPILRSGTDVYDVDVEFIIAK
jgi:hypothetical protein